MATLATIILAPLIAAYVPPLQPANFQNIMRSTGCTNGQFHGTCQSSRGIMTANCAYVLFTSDLQPNKEHCIYHQSDLNVTTCFIFSNVVLMADANYLIQQILWKDIFGLFERLTFGVVNWAWTQGYIWSNDNAYGTYYGVSINGGEQRTLGTTLPSLPMTWPTNMEMHAWYKEGC
ncbi:hypothetical protein BGZ83_008184 [Gryganskiella cystojenkinii]|nr:hypothetical protein BGZ83_008184 [Gryganskiella cystojenkinii]